MFHTSGKLNPILPSCLLASLISSVQRGIFVVGRSVKSKSLRGG